MKKSRIKIIISSLLVVLIGIFLLPETAYLSNISAEKIIELTNKERTINNIHAVTANQLLTKAAYNKGHAILDTQIFQHNIGDKKFSAWIKDAGYAYSYIGENLAVDFVTSEGAIAAWLASPTHKKNILNPYFNEIGLSVLEGRFNNHNTILIVQIFGSPPSAPLSVNLSVSTAEEANQSFSDNYSLSMITGNNFPARSDNDYPIWLANNQLTDNFITLTNRDSSIAALIQNNPPKTNIFSSLNNSRPVRSINLFLSNHILTLRVLFMLLILSFTINGLRSWPQLRYWLTSKNKQLKLPLK